MRALARPQANRKVVGHDDDHQVLLSAVRHPVSPHAKLSTVENVRVKAHPQVILVILASDEELNIQLSEGFQDPKSRSQSLLAEDDVAPNTTSNIRLVLRAYSPQKLRLIGREHVKKWSTLT